MPSILKKQPTKFQNIMTIISWVYDLKHDYEYDCKSCFFQVVVSVNCDLMVGVYSWIIMQNEKDLKSYPCSHWQIQEIQNTQKQGDMCVLHVGEWPLSCVCSLVTDRDLRGCPLGTILLIRLLSQQSQVITFPPPPISGQKTLDLLLKGLWTHTADFCKRICPATQLWTFLLS